MIKCEFENGDKAGLRHVTVDLLLFKENKIILEKRGNRNGQKIMLEAGKWADIGGFVDRDETISEAVRREATEETGFEIKNLKLFRIIDNPNRPAEDRQNISFVFIAEAGNKIGQSDDEVSEIKFFELEDLPPKDQFAFDHYENIELYKKYQKEKFDLPLLS